MADENTALVFIVFVAGLGLGVPLGFALAYFVRPKTSVVSLERDDKGRITAIVEK